MPARTIAIEGCDGAGKATQTEMLVQYLMRDSAQGRKVERISFPRYYRTNAGRLLAEFLKSKQAHEYDFANANPKLASRIYAQDRFESRELLAQMIAENDFVIFDRYVESNLIHQGGKLHSDADRIAFAQWLFELEYKELALPRPDVVVYLDLPHTVSFARARRRAEERGEEPDVVESNTEYVKNSWRAGKLYTEMFGWRAIECATVKTGIPSDVERELTPDEVHERILEVLGV